MRVDNTNVITNRKQNKNLFSNSNNQILKNNLNEKNITDLAQFYPNGSLNFQGNGNYITTKQYLQASKNFTPETQEIINIAKKIAQKTNSKEVQSWHIYYAILLKLRNYFIELDEGTIKYELDKRFKTVSEIESMFGPQNSEYLPNIFDKKENVKKAKEVVEEHLKQTRKTFVSKEQMSQKRNYPFGISLSQEAMSFINETYEILKSRSETGLFHDSFLYAGLYNSKNRKLVKEITNFEYNLKKSIIVKQNKKDENHLEFYNDKADIIWKNISAGKNVAVLCDVKNYPQLEHLTSSFINLINKPDQSYKNIDPKKTKVITLNDLADLHFLTNLVNECKQKEDVKSVIVVDFISLLKNSGTNLGKNFIATLENNDKENSNVRFVLTMNPESYYINAEKDAVLSKGLLNYACQTLPTLNAQETIKYLTNENGINYVKDIIKKDVTPEAIKKAIELSAAEDSNYPDKAVNLLKSTSLFHSEEETITQELVESYIQKTKNLSETQRINSDNKVIFNTQKTLADIVGTPMTKADAENIVSQIKRGIFKTKGYTIYQANGSSYGGGRRNTAFAIAGETGIPVITVNAKDFALKDIDALSQNADFSEIKIKKIISDAKAQAETNPYNTAMIYIENFDNFGSNPLYGFSGIYEQKAFSQLLEEMDNTRRNDSSNLLIIGSVNMPEIIDENIMKPNRFLNSIIVYGPRTTQETKEVFEYYIDKMNLKIKGETKEEQQKTIDTISQTAQGFSVVDIIYLLETAKNVAQEREHESISLNDFTEAYLQTTTGRTAGSDLNEHGKNIVTSHEAGHALTLQIMNEVAKKYGSNWHLPDKVNFITLDPRGYYGGAMFHKQSENHENSFEKIMSDLICAYGGHSAEKIIYGIKGSWGITGDMQSACELANCAVLDMGMGAKTGVRHIPKDKLGQPKVSQKKMEAIEEDVDSLLTSAMQISDEIVAIYKDFIIDFTQRHSKDVGNGNCLISSQEFLNELNAWRSKQDGDKQAEFEKLESTILRIQNRVQTA